MAKIQKIYDSKIKKVTEVLKKIKPQKIILFGSVASGKIRKDADIDFCIIKKTKDPWKIKQKISDLIWEENIGFDPELDFHVYSPEVYFDWLKRHDPFIEEIEKGKVLYEG